MWLYSTEKYTKAYRGRGIELPLPLPNNPKENKKKIEKSAKMFWPPPSSLFTQVIKRSIIWREKISQVKLEEVFPLLFHFPLLFPFFC